MNLDLNNIDTMSADNTFMGMNMDPTHLVWTTILTLVVSHVGAKYLMEVTPKGYWFWFTIINIVFGFLIM